MWDGVRVRVWAAYGCGTGLGFGFGVLMGCSWMWDGVRVRVWGAYGCGMPRGNIYLISINYLKKFLIKISFFWISVPDF